MHGTDESQEWVVRWLGGDGAELMYHKMDGKGCSDPFTIL